MTTRPQHRIMRLVVLGTMALALASAQSLTSITDFTTPPSMQPGAPAGGYPLSGFDTVNLYSGTVSFSIPLLGIGGRGEAGYTMSLPLQMQWRIENIPTQNSLDTIVPVARQIAHDPLATGASWKRYAPGTVVGRPSVDTGAGGKYFCPANTGMPGAGDYFYFGQTLTRLTFIEPDGTEHELRDTAMNGQPAPGRPYVSGSPDCSHTLSQGSNRGTTFTSNDGSFLTFVSDAAVHDVIGSATAQEKLDVGLPVSGWLLFPNGVKYQFNTSGEAVKIQDRNGNLVQICYADTGCDTSGNDFTVTDALGRQIFVKYADFITNFTDTMTYSGYNTASRTVNVNWANMSATGVLRSDQSIQTYLGLFPNANGSGATNFDVPVVASVGLPDSTQYTIQYNSYGEPVRVVLPTGGAYEYDYPTSTPLCMLPEPPATNLYGCMGPDPNNNTDSVAYLVIRRIMQRRELPNGSSASLQINFTPTYAAGTTQVLVENKDASTGTVLSSDIHTFWGDASNPSTYSVPNFYPAPFDGREYETDQLSGSQTLRKVVNTWAQRPCVTPGEVCWPGISNIPHDARICQTSTTLLDATPNITSGVVSAYDQYNNRSDLWEFDYGNAPAQDISACPATPASGYSRHTTATFLTTANNVSYDTANVGNPSASIHVRSRPTNQSVHDANNNLASKRDYVYDTPSFSLQNDSGITNQASGYSTSNTTRANLTEIHEWYGSSYINLQGRYDIAGNLVTSYDGNGNATTITFDPAYKYAFPTQACKSVSGQNFCVAQGFDLSTGKLTRRQDFNGNSTTLQYDDGLDRLMSVQTPDGATTNISYTSSDTVVTSVSDLDSSNRQKLYSRQYLDGLGRNIETRQYLDGTGSSSNYISVQTVYDALGRRSQVSNPFNPSLAESAEFTTTQYDSLGRVTRIQTPDGAQTTLTPLNNTNNSVDPAGADRTATTDALGRLTQVVESPSSLNYTTVYTYDAADNLIRVNQCGTAPCNQSTSGLVRSFTYDLLKRLTSTTNPESGTTNYTSYDGNGNLLVKTDNRNVQTTINYDELNEILTKSYSDSTPSVSYTYYDSHVPNSKGRLTQVLTNATAPQIQSTWKILSYDVMRRPTSSSESVGSVTPANFSYTYNLAGKLTSEGYPSGRTVQYAYDFGARVEGATGVNGTRYAGNCSNALTNTCANPVVYASHGAIEQIQFGNGGLEQTCFNNRLQVTGIRFGTSTQSQCANSGSDLLNIGFGYGSTNNNGNVAGQTIAGAGLTSALSQTYTYDTLNRIHTFTETGGQASQTYNYDFYGNRWVTLGGFIPYSGQTPTSNVFLNNHWGWTTGMSCASQTSDVQYDCGGNQTNLVAEGRTFTYDAENRVITATAAGSTTRYTYDGEGRRTAKAAAVTTTFIYDAFGQLAAEYGGATTGSGTEYLTPDHLGSTRLISNGIVINNVMTPQVVERLDYAPFGEELGQGIDGRGTQYSNNSYPTATLDSGTEKFTSKERDVETGLDYFGARYFSSAQGRFTTPDWSERPQPIPYADLSNPQTLNLYSYVINNPLNRTDPLGHNWFQIDDKWEWHKGKTYTRTDSQGNQQTFNSKYTGLLVAERTGTNAKGATTFKYTLYDQNKVVGTGSGFSGGRDEAGGFHNPIRDGNYQILTAHDPSKPTAPQPGDPDNNPPVSYRIQEIDRTLNGYAEAVYQAYGPIRARLNPLNGPDVGDYFHGQFNGRGWTHGCLCYGTDPRMINYMWNTMPNTWVGVSVNVPVVKP